MRSELAIEYEKLLTLKFPEVEHTYTSKDCILYAIGVGVGLNPINDNELPFVYEKNLKVLPTQAVILGHPGFWIRDLDTGLDWVKIVHGEQSFILHQPLAANATIVGRTRLIEIVDKGRGKGVLLYLERRISDKKTGDLIGIIGQTIFCRGEGGFGGAKRSLPPPHLIPQREPDLICDLPTRPEAALIYRLSGDFNPLHVDPAVAKAAGFERPILHGLATFGVAGHALLKLICNYNPNRLRSVAGRFSAPVFPGETIRTELWIDGTIISFRCYSLEQNVMVLSNGRAEVI